MRCTGRAVQLVEPLEREREVRAALGAGERVDLVDDHGLDAAQGLARRRREHEEEGLGRRDEDLGGMRDSLRRSAGGVSPERTPDA